MATETLDRAAAHRRSLKVTATASIVGVVAGLLTQVVAAGPADSVSIMVVIGAVLAVLGISRLLGVDVDDFSTKDHLYVAFMTFTLWFVTWTILLTAGTTL